MENSQFNLSNDNLTIQTQGAFDRIRETLIKNHSDDLDSIIYNLERLLIKARQIKTEISIDISGDFQ